MQDGEERGFELLDHGKVAEARQLAAKLVEAEPNDVSALCLMAAVEVESDDLEAAMVFLDRANKADPEDVRPHIQRAEVLLYSQEPARARQAALAAIDCAGDEADFIDAVMLKATADLELDDDTAARAAMEELANVDIDEPPLLLRAGDLWLDLSEWQRAADAFGRVVALEPELADAHYGLGCAQAELEDDEAATRSWLVAYELDGTSSSGEVPSADALKAAIESKIDGPLAINIADRPRRGDVEAGLDPRVAFDFDGAHAVTVFRMNLAAPAFDLEEVASDVCDAIREELAEASDGEL